jgi:hypothetical protein
MEIDESLIFIRKNVNYIRGFLDDYEMELLFRAIQGE